MPTYEVWTLDALFGNPQPGVTYVTPKEMEEILLRLNFEGTTPQTKDDEPDE